MTVTISHEYAEELGRQIDELEAENERLRDGIARCMFDKAMSGHAQWDEMTEPNKEDWRVRADEWMAAAPVDASERDRCIAICQGWAARFDGEWRRQDYAIAREFAYYVVNDIIDLIRDGKWPGGV